MIAVLTGDVIRSRQVDPGEWLPSLKEALDCYGSCPRDWEIFRGDSFQLKLSPDRAFRAMLHLKAAILRHQGLDVRLGIGIGALEFDAPRVTESNGPAFHFSGNIFASLKRRKTGFQSGDEAFDEGFNLMLDLCQLVIDRWTPKVALVILISLTNPTLNQVGISQLLHRSQSSISEALQRGGFEELMAVDDYFKNKWL